MTEEGISVYVEHRIETIMSVRTGESAGLLQNHLGPACSGVLDPAAPINLLKPRKDSEDGPGPTRVAESDIQVLHDHLSAGYMLCY